MRTEERRSVSPTAVVDVASVDDRGEGGTRGNPAFSRLDRILSSTRNAWIDVAWVAFVALNLIAMQLIPAWGTVPFLIIWVSLAAMYGFRLWRLGSTLLTVAAVTIATGGLIGWQVLRKEEDVAYLAEVPLLATLFVVTVWHARKRQAALEEAHRASEQNLRIMHQQHRFIQDASHELRTPITVAMGHAELIHEGSKEEEVRQDARVVIGELARLHRISERLLVLAASEHPDFLSKERIDLEPTVVEVMRRWTPIDREWILGGLEDATVDADPDRLALAIDALVENAVKHTGSGDAISVSVRLEGGCAVVAVADTGTGIAREHVPLIFDRFARADSARSRKGGGAGLGLAIVKSVVEAHGGSVAVRSDPGNGSVFELTLPLASTSPGSTI
jgi:signal transduction histidine kinase